MEIWSSFQVRYFWNYICQGDLIHKESTLFTDGSIYLESVECTSFGTGFSPYSDNLLVVRAASLEVIPYVKAPVVFVRTHDTSISFTSTDLASFFSAKSEFAAKCLQIFQTERLRHRSHDYINFLARWLLPDFAGLLVRSGGAQAATAMAHLPFFIRFTGNVEDVRVRVSLFLYGLRKVCVSILRIVQKAVSG